MHISISFLCKFLTFYLTAVQVLICAVICLAKYRVKFYLLSFYFVFFFHVLKFLRPLKIVSACNRCAWWPLLPFAVLWATLSHIAWIESPFFLSLSRLFLFSFIFSVSLPPVSLSHNQVSFAFIMGSIRYFIVPSACYLHSPVHLLSHSFAHGRRTRVPFV